MVSWSVKGMGIEREDDESSKVERGGGVGGGGDGAAVERRRITEAAVAGQAGLGRYRNQVW